MRSGQKDTDQSAWGRFQVAVPYPAIQGAETRMLEGSLKIQLGLFYVVETITSEDAQQTNDARVAIGYALFDLQHQQLTPMFVFFSDVLMAAKTLARVYER